MVSRPRWTPTGSPSVCERARALRAGSTGGPVVTFRPEGSLEQTVGDLKEQGVEVPAGISEHSRARVATFKDSEGNDPQLYEPPSN